MQGVWTPDQIRAAEQRLFARTPEPTVMRRAAFAVSVHTARVLAESTGGVAGRRVALLVGAGNNGGDALWAGAFLRRRGVGVTAVLLAPEKAHPAGLAALRRTGGRAVPAEGASPDTAGIGADAADAVQRADVVIDGIVGLSGRGPLRATAAELVRRVTVPVVAVDLPSGVDPVTGTVDGPAVEADVTVTFGGRKPCHVLGAGSVLSGDVEVVDIGVADELPDPELSLLEAAEIGAAWPVPRADDDKYSQGVVGVAAGSATYPGAAVLASGAAVQATSGMVRYAGPAADVVRAHWPEVVATGSVADAGRVQAWAVGPGIGTGASGRDVLRHVLESGRPVCADADSITLFAADETLWDARDPDVPVVLTPHAGEFARLAGEEPGADRVAAAREVAARFDAVLLLKGNTTIIAAPDGRVLVNDSRHAWPATAGSGDVLTGLIGALLASGIEPWLACGYAAHVHALAAELAARGATRDRPAGAQVGAPIGASALLAAVPDAIRLVRTAALT
ncbi:bifunctional NAD(P)H-hydrate repair enzyme [Saccharopolyspora subtropica]|uniref:Bifunctional NAD(P)H-hydrate repair enzyme n=1 Tax=Saccharopolyspora thermophila TaxID=89367 RepID=A0A917NAT9_9PSEU|nr:NAD(P)H-hydrate dehydratase [Saccharopolyspora subtropica]GGI78910.1 bifunctional NAD(P)H-hydrate repair enzyme [Saccharopolyspora subtropica]